MIRIAQPRTGEAPNRVAGRSELPRPARALELQRTIGNRRTTRLIQRVVHPLDVGSELVGRKLSFTSPFKVGGVELAAGTLVTIESWTNGSATVRVKPDGGGAAGDVPKKLLRHAEAAVAGITQYGVGLGKVVRDYERGEKKIADEKARKGGPDATELTELEGLQKKRQALLDERLIQETMFNRFDASIKKWVDHYGAKLGFTGKQALDPEIVKSMLFEETQMGTEGQHLDEPASNAIRTRFNIGQGPIDSGAITMIHILREEDPALFALYKLDGAEKAMSDAQDELVRLKKLRSPNATEQARIDQLTFASGARRRQLGDLSLELQGAWLHEDAVRGGDRMARGAGRDAAQVRLRLLDPGDGPAAVHEAQAHEQLGGRGARLQRQGHGCRELLPQARDEPARQGQGGGEGQDALRGGQPLSGQERLDHGSGQRSVEELADPAFVVGPFGVGRGRQPAPAALGEDVRELCDRHREVRRVLDAPGSARLRIRGADDTRPPRVRAVLDEDQGELLGRVGQTGVVEVEDAEAAVPRAADVVGPEVAVTGA